MLLKKSFRGGAHPPEEKYYSEKKAIVTPPLPESVVIPLQQHIGAPSEPIVEKGDAVKTGQPISKTVSFVSVPAHASVTGTVEKIAPMPHPLGITLPSVIIKREGDDVWYGDTGSRDTGSLTDGEIRKIISEAGIAGMGGAAFPTHVKLSPPDDKPVDVLIINGVECEPFLTSDHRLMLEHPDELIEGIRFIQRVLGVDKVIIGIEKNKPDAISLLKAKTASVTGFSILPLAVKYPQGAEKQLISAATGRAVPAGGLPMDIGAVVQNVGTAVAVYEAVVTHKPLIERVVTVTGPGVREPRNVRARIGTSFRSLIEFCGGYTGDAAKIINGGPMMGISQITDTVPVIKGTSGILVFDRTQADLVQEKPCISCARCVDICPMNLVPSHIAACVEYGNVDRAADMGLMDCMECGTCSFICPSKRNLVQYIKQGKARWNNRKQ